MVSDLKLQTEMQKERVKETAKKWASIQMIKRVIRNKLERHKKVELPRLLETAGAFFRPLTDGSYKTIYFSETDDSIMVMHCDGTVYHADELSQGRVSSCIQRSGLLWPLPVRMGQGFRSSLTTALFILIRKDSNVY